MEKKHPTHKAKSTDKAVRHVKVSPQARKQANSNPSLAAKPKRARKPSVVMGASAEAMQTAAVVGVPNAGSRRARRMNPDAMPKDRYKSKTTWWAVPVTTAMTIVLVLLCVFMTQQFVRYSSFLHKKHTVNRETFYPGVTIDGMDVSEISYSQALEMWEKHEASERAKYNIVLALDNESWPINAEALGYQNNYREQLQSAWAVGRYGTLDERYRAVSAMRETGWERNFESESGISEATAMEKLEPFARSLSVEPADAKVVSFNEIEKTFEFSDGKRGYVTDPEELYYDILRAAQSGGGTLTVAREEIVPEDTAQTLMQTYGLIASATTDAGFSNSNRLTNLKVACRQLNGMRVEPGETFSFNKALGKRTAKAGYRPAAAYENGITTNQYGGGICQISTTLFNAVAKADLKITERSPHSRPSSYIGLGKDAAVNWPNQDFKFINSTNYPIYIVAQVTSKKKVRIGVYGKRMPNGMKIDLSSTTTKVYAPRENQYKADSSLAPGERVVVEAARKGFEATTYKHYINEKGKEVRKVVLCKSYYAPSGAIIKVGR